MRVAVFLNNLGLGGTEKAGCRWAWGLQERGHRVVLLTLHDGPRRAELEQRRVDVEVVGASAAEIAGSLRTLSPDVIHAHAPGHPHEGDVLGEALVMLPKKIPVVQTNVFGQLHNPKENAWTDFRLFISWTSCVQAARRIFRPLDEDFFRRASVVVYPVDPVDPPPDRDIQSFRQKLGVADQEVLFGRLSRPDPNKWTPLALDAFQLALRRNPMIKLLLREPPPHVAEMLRASPDVDRFVIMPVTSESDELRLTMSAMDVVLHTSSIGESFGYGLAEPMNLGKPVITHSVPWHDQAQLELVRHGECGFIASTPATMARAILRLASDTGWRRQAGAAARGHIRALANPGDSIARLERILTAAIERADNPFNGADLKQATAAAYNLDVHQFGCTLGEQLALRLSYYRARLHQLRKRFDSD